MLANRVQKARDLQRKIVVIPGTTGRYGMRSIESGEHYNIKLVSHKMTSRFADKSINHRVFECECERNASYHNGQAMEACRGNERHTVCYHCLATLMFSLGKAGIQIVFHEDVFYALNYLNFGGELVMVESAQGGGHIWATIRKMEKKVTRTQTERINLMRGPVEEGID